MRTYGDKLPGGVMRHDEIVERPIEHLSYGRSGLELSRGDVNLLAAHPGGLKSTLAAQWAAEHSRIEGRGRVLFVTEEDPTKATRPRYRMMGGHSDRALYTTRSQTIDDLRLMCRGEGIDLIIADPMPSLIAIDDSNSNDDVRQSLERLQREVLNPMQVTVLGLMHMSKNTARDTVLQRMLGAGAFGQLARQVYVLGRAPSDDDDDHHIDVADEKHSYSRRRATVRMRIEPMRDPDDPLRDTGLVRLVEVGSVYRTPLEVASGRTEPARSSMQQWVLHTLDGSTGMTRGRLLELAQQDPLIDCARATLYRAIRDLIAEDRCDEAEGRIFAR